MNRNRKEDNLSLQEKKEKIKVLESWRFQKASQVTYSTL